MATNEHRESSTIARTGFRGQRHERLDALRLVSAASGARPLDPRRRQPRDGPSARPCPLTGRNGCARRHIERASGVCTSTWPTIRPARGSTPNPHEDGAFFVIWRAPAARPF